MVDTHLSSYFFIFLRKILKNISRGFNARAITIAGPAIFLQYHTIRERLTAFPHSFAQFRATEFHLETLHHIGLCKAPNWDLGDKAENI